MSPDAENELRERYPDLLYADTEINIGDGWAVLVDGMLAKIREVVGTGRIKLTQLYSMDGSLRVDLRAAQVDSHVVARVRGQILRTRWHTFRTPEHPDGTGKDEPLG